MQNYPVEHFSSDFKNNVLIYTDKANNLKIEYSNRQECIGMDVPHWVQFYPVDTDVFTTTSAEGLKVYDTERKQIIYKYRHEELKEHKYGPKALLASFDENNIKMYDLRMKYMVSNITLRNVEHIGWMNDQIVCLKENNLILKDIRNYKNVKYISNVKSFAISNNILFYTTISRGSTASIYTWDGDELNGKQTKFKTICPIVDVANRVTGITSSLDGKVVIEALDSIWTMKDVDASEVHALYFGDFSSYMFKDYSLCKIEGGYREIKNRNLSP